MLSAHTFRSSPVPYYSFVASTTPASPWNISSPVRADTLPFFQHLLGPSPPSAEECDNIADTLSRDALLACSDGSHLPTAAQASHGWVIADNIETILSSNSAPTDGHPLSLSSYQAELSGLLAMLYMLYKISRYYNMEGKKATIYCDDKGALNNVFRQPRLGLTPFFTAHYDLLEVAYEHLSLAPLSITGTWVKGHYTGQHRTF